MTDGFREPRELMIPPGQVECQVADMTLTAAADVPLAKVQQELAAHAQWLAVDGDESLPVGELVEQNSTGPLRLGFGGWRDVLLGCQFKNGRGELISAGGRTMKNVAGYDLTKLMVGQRGAFGEILTITARTYRMPDGCLLVRFPGLPHASTTRLTDLLTTPCRPHWALIDSESLLCGYLSDQPTLDYLQSSLSRYEPADMIAQSLEQDAALRRSLLSGASQGSGLRFRASIPPAELGQFVASLEPQKWIADGAFGVVWGLHAGPPPIIMQAADRLGGGATVWNGSRIVQSRQPPGVDDLLRRLKSAFDPDGILRPMPETD
jgi:glycolate oxidase FAD binding subunit